jgi:hypothetical protein
VKPPEVRNWEINSGTRHYPDNQKVEQKWEEANAGRESRRNRDKEKTDNG